MEKQRYDVEIELMNGRTNNLTVWAENESIAKERALKWWGNPTIYRCITARVY